MRRSGRFDVIVLIAAFVAFVYLPVRASDTKRSIVPEDLFKMNFVSTATISHDGKRVAFVVSKLHLATNKYQRNIWIAEADGSRVWQLTRGDGDGEPAWSPDDRTLAFSRDAGKGGQIYAIELSGGEGRPLTHQRDGASAPAWSHDGASIAFTARATDPSPRSHVDWPALGLAARANEKTDIRTIPWPRYEANGEGYTYAKHAHIWIVGRGGGDARQLTFGADGEMFSDWSPDDRRIAFVSDPLSDPEGDAAKIFVISASGGTATPVATGHYGVTAPLFTHAGNRLVYSYINAHDAGGYPALASADLDGTHEATAVGPNVLAIGDAVISDTKEGGAGCGLIAADDRSFVAIVSVPGATEIDALDLQSGGRVRLAGGTNEIQDCSASRDTRTIAYSAGDATHLAEVYVFDRITSEPRRLTDFNDALTGSLALATPEAHSVSSGRAGTVAYWVLKPPRAVAGKRYPVILDIHGGPATEFGESFFDEFQTLAARGFIIVYANPRGSVGYGYDFEEALLGDWNDAMQSDETAVMDEVVRRGDVDPAHTFVSGGSYGGYATLWMISHTNRFRAALAERPAANLFTETLAADFAAPLGFEGAPGTPHAWGAPLSNYAKLWQQSPLAHVASVHTPLLLVHSDADTRTPIAETLQEYEALKMLGRRVELVQFPRENHDLSRTGEPIHRVERLHLMADWFERFLK